MEWNQSTSSDGLTTNEEFPIPDVPNEHTYQLSEQKVPIKICIGILQTDCKRNIRLRGTEVGVGGGGG